MLSFWEKNTLEEIALNDKCTILVGSHDIKDVIDLFPFIEDSIINGSDKEEELLIMGRIHLLMDSLPSIKDIYKWGKSIENNDDQISKLIILISSSDVLHFERKYSTMEENFNKIENGIRVKIFIFHKRS